MVNDTEQFSMSEWGEGIVHGFNAAKLIHLGKDLVELFVNLFYLAFTTDYHSTLLGHDDIRYVELWSWVK